MNKCVIFVISLILILSAGIFSIRFHQTSQYNGKILTQNQKYGEVEIKRDEQGVPHIYGKNKPSSFYGLGYSVCQDRLWQIEYKKYVGYGKLSTIFGEKTFPVDVFMKSIGAEESGKKALEHFKNEDLEVLQAYVDGINECARNLPYLPLEFQILGVKFQEWTVLDAIVVTEFMAIAFAYNYQFESINDRLREVFDDDFVIKFSGGAEPYFVYNTTILNDEDLKKSGLYKEYTGNLKDSIEQARQNIKKVALQEFQGVEQLWEQTKDFYPEQIYGKQSGFGSNSWAVSGQFTESGKPMVSADPHLLHDIPNFWYQAEVLWGDEKQSDYIIGAHVPGSVIFPEARNEYFGFGITLSENDSTDYFELQLNKDETKYLHDGEWIPLKIRTEYIQIKGQSQKQEVQIKYSHHGPLVNLAMNKFAKNPFYSNGKTTALGWSGFTNIHTTMFNFYKLNTAKNLEDLKKYMKNLDKFGFSLVFATLDNHIGFYSTGTLPIRNNPIQGLYIQDGSKSANNWAGFTKPDELAHVVDPSKGFIVASNNRISSNNIIYHNQLTHNFNQARAKRIQDIIQSHIKSKTAFSAETFKNIHTDITDPVCQDTFLTYVEIAEKYLDKFQWDKSEQEIGTFRQTLENIKNDKNRCYMSKDKYLPAVYTVWQKKLKFLLFTPEHLYQIAKKRNPDSVRQMEFYKKLQSDIIDNYTYNVHFNTNLLREWEQNLKNQLEQDQDFCENNFNANVNGNKCYYNVVLALFQTLEYLQVNNVQNYGQIHTRTFKHQPFSSVPYLNHLFERTIPASGTGDTPNVAPLDENFRSIYSCNFRAIFNMDPNGKNYWVQDTGISGNPLSPHYDDQMEKFASGEFYEMKFGYQNFREMQAKYQLILEPSRIQKNEF